MSVQPASYLAAAGEVSDQAGAGKSLREAGLVLFDFDGTLVDAAEKETFELVMRTVETELKDMGFDANFSGIDPMQFSGWATEAMVEYLVHGINVSAEQKKQIIDTVHTARIDQRPSANVKAVAQAEEYLQFLKEQGIPFAIVTNSKYQRVVNYLRHVGLLKYFEHKGDAASRAGPLPPYRIVSAYDHCQNIGKPDGLPYAEARMRYGPRVAANQIVAFEDSSSGVRSARNAGITNVMGMTVCSQIANKPAHAKKLQDAGAAHIFGTFQQVIDAHKGGGGNPAPATSVSLKDGRKLRFWPQRNFG
ncbi:MAG: HAD hydrolase-like protein [Alphaproteobacteria bacterium]|nr:HAD hydrolase-like protein [Alphaproteobacteria bacterium]